ncbi:Ornithine carbamoyltransferase [invertebrate metagenome]|uniref:ornithine carbamoyltransferase n=1 Tax=invertebrate metagenome TaxID=1711999 RepID=A0A2H9T8W9_9ZZZZ
MPYNLRHRNYLKLLDFNPKEIQFLLDLGRDLKRAKYAGVEQPRLKGKNIALIFEKTSTRTRCAFEVAAYDQGANVTYISGGSQMGHKESVKDTARVLGRFYDGIEFRGFSQDAVEELGQYAGVPVWNGLTDTYHPTQLVADFMTMLEHGKGKRLEEMKLCYPGDGKNNMGNSIMVACAKMGVDMSIAAPKGYFPEKWLIDECQKIAQKTGAKLVFTEDITEAVKGADFLYGDVWVSMGEPEEKWAERIEMLKPYQVTMSVMKATDNPDAKYLHCLPAFHNTDTTIGKMVYDKFGLDGIEVTEDVFESDYCIAFDEAENRMHAIKAILVATLGD